MEYRYLGQSALRVSPLCLGTMMFGGATDEATAKRIVDKARGQGINFLDAADSVAPLRPVIGRRAAGRIQGLVQDKAQMPFGGVNASRYGCFGGVAGVHEFTGLRWITITSGPGHYPI